MSKQHPRGPAPDDHPDNEDSNLTNSGEPLTRPEAPDGYPDEAPPLPQVPGKSDPKHKPRPTGEGH